MTEKERKNIREQIDRKIKTMYGEGKSLSLIANTLINTGNNFKNLLENNATGSRAEMIACYSEHSLKRAEDLEKIKNSYKQLNINTNDVRNN